MTVRRKMEIAGMLAAGLMGATVDAARILRDATRSVLCEYRLAVMLAEHGLTRDDVVTLATPSDEWVVLPNGTSERIG